MAVLESRQRDISQINPEHNGSEYLLPADRGQLLPPLAPSPHSFGDAAPAMGKTTAPLRAFFGFLAVTLVSLIAGWGVLFSQAPAYERLNVVHRYVSSSIVDRWEHKMHELPEEARAIIDDEALLEELTYGEKALVQKIFAIDPKVLGFTGPCYSKEKPPNLVKVPPVVLNVGGSPFSTGVQYCPEHVFLDYAHMMDRMEQEIGKRLFIDSAYRSPGRQAYLFFSSLVKNHNYSLQETARWVALPGFSEHGSPRNTAIDFINAAGINGDRAGQTAADFEQLPEFHWLLHHAHQFHFFLSYPQNNPWGVTYEPWHWHWENPGSR